MRAALPSLLARVLFVLLLLGAAAAHADPPARVARLNHAEGSVSLAPAGDNEWTEAPANRPLTRGDRLWTDRGSRAELQIGASALRLDGQSRLDILALDDQSAQLSLTQGSVYLRVRSLPEGDNFEIDTPNLAWRVAAAGDYRIDVDPQQATTRITVHAGAGVVYGDGGQSQPLGGGQQVTFRTRALVPLAVQESPPQDAFDRWAGERNRREDQSIAARYVPREVVGYQQLDPHGQWRRDATHGPVWFPQGLAAGWAPYRSGHWDWIAPWGWTWIDDAPWGFAPFHYGRWALLDGQWGWVPGRLDTRPVYAPALVAFVGGGPSGIAWFPLAPGEPWQPPYRASPVYLNNVNRNIPLSPEPAYAYQRNPEALTAITAAEFHRGRPAGAGWLRVAANVLTSARVVPPPPMPQLLALADPKPLARKAPAALAPAAPARASATPAVARGPAAALPATALPAAALPDAAAPAATRTPVAGGAPRQPVPPRAVASPPPAVASAAVASPAVALARPAARLAVARPAEEQQRSPAQARVPVPAARGSRAPQAQVRAPEPRPRVPAAARPQPAAAPARLVTSSRPLPGGREQRALPATRAQQARREEQVRREQALQAEHARRESLARRAEQARREAAARREEQLRRAAIARRDEQARRAAHAGQVEQARRSAEREVQALQEQRLRREEQVRREELARRAAQEREQTQREQQAITEQWRREHQAWEQRQRTRGRPDLRQQPPRDETPPRPPEIWQRGIPLLAPGRTS